MILPSSKTLRQQAINYSRVENTLPDDTRGIQHVVEQPAQATTDP
jgi:hypothetical protein